MMAAPANIFIALLLAGLLGMLGQGVRSLAGLKKMNDAAVQQNASSADLFVAARLIISLLTGFLAGVAAGLALGLDKLLGISASNMDVMFGIAAAGYAGTDFIEAFAPTIKGAAVPLLDQPTVMSYPSSPGPAGIPTQLILTQSPTVASLNLQSGITYESLVPGGFFSADPYDLAVPRSIRTNNPGALNFSTWQKSRLGYVGITQPDNSSGHNITTIYRSPEHGIAAWYHLVARLYNFPGGNFTLNELAARYAGANNTAAIAGYVAGWRHWLNPPIAATTQISVTDSNTMQALAKAMFSHEAGRQTPIHADQITFAIEREMAGTLPA
jgi:hypothetical protein